MLSYRSRSVGRKAINEASPLRFLMNCITRCTKIFNAFLYCTSMQAQQLFGGNNSCYWSFDFISLKYGFDFAENLVLHILKFVFIIKFWTLFPVCLCVPIRCGRAASFAVSVMFFPRIYMARMQAILADAILPLVAHEICNLLLFICKFFSTCGRAAT